MAKKKAKTSRQKPELDSVYILKLALFLIIGSQWLYIADGSTPKQLPIPIGALIGLIFATHEHFRIDRKMEYAILIIAMFVGFWLPMGITIIK